MNREEFDKIIESNPETKFKVIKDDEHHFSLGDVVTFKGDIIEDEDGLLLLFNNGIYDQYLRLDQIELISESVVQPLKLKFPCCIATSEIKDEETLKKVQDLFVASGATLEEQLWYTCNCWRYYGVDYDNETRFWDEVREYSATNSAAVTVYTLKDLFPEAPVAPQDKAQEVLAELGNSGIVLAQDDVQAIENLFKVVKHTYYDVTIKGKAFSFTKEEANLLCTMLVEAIGEDYELI